MFSTKRIIRSALLLASTLVMLPAVNAQNSDIGAAGDDDTFLALRDAARRSDARKTEELAARLDNYSIPSYVDYYRLKSRMRKADATVPEILAYLERYDGSAIADRLRNDWLLDLGRARNWSQFDQQYPRFALDDDTQLKCYALLSRVGKGQVVADDARALLVAPKDYGEGCVALIASLVTAGQFGPDDVWAQVRLAAESNNSPVAQQVAAQADPAAAKLVEQALNKSAFTLARGAAYGRSAHESFVVALGRVAKTSSEQAVQALVANTDGLTPQEQAQGWAQIALQAAQKLEPESLDYWRRAEGAPLSLDGYQWRVRSALRTGDWKLVQTAVQAMPAALRNEATWIYWSARANGMAGRTELAQQQFQSIADQTNFYGQLALEELGRQITVPAGSVDIAADEMAPVAANQGLRRALKFFSMGLRFEGTREWNWELRKMSERQHLAVAEFARQNNVLDRMVNTSDRTRTEVDFTQRFPSPYRDTMRVTTQSLGMDMAWVYGLIRQESRFIMNARSQVGASGLMQLMPATAQWVARKIGFSDFAQHQVNDIDTNILLGTNYLSMVLSDLDGSQAMATAAYNAGPGRPRAWRATLPGAVEGAIFAETIPFSETRGYVKNVLSNATYYAALFEGKPQSLKARLGTVAPKGYMASSLP